MNEDFLYHVGFKIIEHPDLKIGRKNADFGQGFYLSSDEEFSCRWAKVRKDRKTYLNKYRIDYTNLSIKYLDRNEEWYDYIFKNRTGYPDAFNSYDIIKGPIANDTIYNIAGVTTSGLLDRQTSLNILLQGPKYMQTVIKSEKAADALEFIEAIELSESDILAYRDMVNNEEAEFQKLVGEILAD